jgi:hypothetical protein
VICCDVRVFAAVGRFLAALVLAGVVVVVGGLPAHACSCVATSTQDDVKAADDVFTGTVADVARSGSARRGTVTYDVAVERVYKGAVRSDRVSVTTSRAASLCGLGDLRADHRYVFLARTSGSELTIRSCGSTGPAHAALVGKIEKLLGDGRDPSPPPPPQQAEFTAVAGSRPPSVTRVAAPGVALVLVGLLGLVVVRRLARRS